MAPPLPVSAHAGSKRDGEGETIMRSPNGPLFKIYEIAAILAFLIAAATVAAFRLVY
jgi:hypothetical protein